MYFSTAAAATFVAFASSAVASPLAPRQTTLEPWQLSGISGFSPSGRPGSSYPWLNIVAHLVDPNEIDLGSASDDGSEVILPAGQGTNCTAEWFSGTNPFNHIWPCDPVDDGYWYMEIEETADFATNNFEVKFTRVADTLYHGSEYKKTFVGSAHFQAGTNGNMGGSCGGSGVCSWGLRPELSPYPIQQTEV